MSRPALSTPFAVLAAEGLAGVLARAADRRGEARRRAAFRSVELERLAELAPVPVLNVLPFPLAARFGGVALQLADRLAAERAARPIALLAFDGDSWRLEVERDGVRLAASGALDRPRSADGAAGAVAWIERAAATLGAGLVHLENLDRLPLGELAELAHRRPVVVSTHDFALFCPRVQLLEEPAERFCSYCRDFDRCRRCLGATKELAGIDPGGRRAAAARLFAAAVALVHPSEFMRRTHGEIFAGGPPRREVVIPPALAIAAPETPRAPLAPPRRVAFFGQASTRKGIDDYQRAGAALASAAPGVEWLVLGGGEPATLLRLRRRGLRVLGSYRAGAGARALVRHRVDLAVLPSRFPESHCLALDECLAAGVPVIAAESGALGERVRALGAGATFGGAERALEAALAAALREPLAPPRGTDPRAIPAAAAAAHRELYAAIDGPSPARP